MQVHEIIGMRYRLGASPEEHGKADCLSMCRTVLSSYNISTPAQRDWYRRLRRGITACSKKSWKSGEKRPLK